MLSDHSISIKLFFTVWLVYAVHVIPAGGVTPNRYLDLVHAIVNEGRFAIDTYHENTIDKAYYDGHYYAGALPGPAFLAVPAYMVFKGIYAALPQSLKEVAGGVQSYKVEEKKDTGFYGQVDNVEFFLSQAFLGVFVVGLFSALACVLFFMVLLLFKTDQGIALFLTFLFAFGTIFFWNATRFFEQAFTIFFALAGFYLIFRMRLQGFTKKGVVLAGFLAGCSLLVEFSGAFVGVLLFGYLLLVNRKPVSFFYWVGFAIPVVILMLYNYSLFQDPFSTPYHHLDEAGFEGVVSEGYIGVTYPHLDRFVGLLVSPERGIIVFAPVVTLGLAGIFHALRSGNKYKPEAIFFALITLVALLFISSFRGWNAGGAFGPRYIMFSLPFMVLPATFIVNKSNLNIVFVIGFVSVIINWTGAQYGFAKNYYEHLENLLSQGPTLPVLEAIASHATSSHPLFEFIKTYKPLLSSAVLLLVLVMILFLWRWPPRMGKQ